MEAAAHTAPLRVGKKMRKRRELDALVGGTGGRLLSASSDEAEAWCRRSARRRRPRPLLRLAAVAAVFVCAVSATTVLWLFVDVRRQIIGLRMEIDRVSTSSDGVGDALQRCHTAEKELRANSTELAARLGQLEREHAELSRRVLQAGVELAAVTEQLAAAPKLADTPRRLAELQRTVADFGSQINGFDGALSSTRKQAVSATAGLDEVKALIHALDGRTNDTIANVTASVRKGEELSDQLKTLNTTVLGRIDALQTKLERVANLATPPSTPASVTSTSSSTTASTTTSTKAPEQRPIKPVITQ